jgi:hypothetical protein
MKRALLAVFLLSCVEDHGTAPSTDANVDAPDVTDTSENDPDGPCRVTLTEVDSDFIEADLSGRCEGSSLAIFDATCAPLTDIFFPAALPSRALFDGLTLPSSLIITLRDPTTAPLTSWLIGTCTPPPDCRLAESTTCLPADTTRGSVALCGSRWSSDRPATPDAPNDCACQTDCEAVAPSCNSGQCVDGTCVFTPTDEGLPCDDVNLCTSNDRCTSGTCLGTPTSCASTSTCQSAGTCDPSTGLCLYSDKCPPNATCTDNGCICAPGFRLVGSTCTDIDECAEDTDLCNAPARCLNTPGTYACSCPPGYAGDGWTCTPSNCTCPWETTCSPRANTLKIEILDLWGQPLSPNLTLIDLTAGDPPHAISSGTTSTTRTFPLCAPRSFALTADAPHHHAFSATLTWDGTELSVDSTPSPDTSWVLSESPAGLSLKVGLAHRWFASSGYPARTGHRIDLHLSHESAWSALELELRLAERLITGTSWKWKSDFELTRDRRDLDLPSYLREDATILGLLQSQAVETKLIMNQFISQDGLFSDLAVDDALLEVAEDWSDPIEYMGQANPSAGEFTVTLPSLDLASLLDIPSTTILDSAAATPFARPIRVDLNDLPFGLSNFNIPIASWHQKYWTFDEKVALIGGMNADKVEWDTSAHEVFDPRRMDFAASPADRRAVARKERLPDFEPYKDYMVRVEGPMVNDAVDIFHKRWRYLLDEDVTYADRSTAFTPTRPATAIPRGVEAQLLTTMPPPFSDYSIFESLMRAVSQASRLIVIEDQYFRAPILYDRIIERMTEVPDLALIVITNPVSEWTDPACWQTAIAYSRFAALFPDRFRLYRMSTFDYVRLDCTFCWDETEAHFADIYIHSKLVLIDDSYLEVGSCNSNNRGLLYEGELAVAVFDPIWVKSQRRRIFESLLGPTFRGDMPLSEVIPAFDEAAAHNENALALWENASMDLDLDGDPVPSDMLPIGFLYPMRFNAPDACLLEGLGPDIM